MMTPIERIAVIQAMMLTCDDPELMAKLEILEQEAMQEYEEGKWKR